MKVIDLFDKYKTVVVYDNDEDEMPWIASSIWELPDFVLNSEVEIIDYNETTVWCERRY